MQYYVAVIDFPINVGGRPLHSWPSFIIITFELTIFFAALATVLGLLGLCGLPMPYHPCSTWRDLRWHRATGFFFALKRAIRYSIAMTRPTF